MLPHSPRFSCPRPGRCMSRSPSPLFTPPSSPPLPGDDVASLCGLPIPGLYYFADFLTSEEADDVVEGIVQHGYFDVEGGRDQAVLFGSRGTEAGLPVWTQGLLSLAMMRLFSKDDLPSDVLDLLFPTQGRATTCTRQLILNCYQPGQGISSHVDLPHKFDDGIMLFSFGSGITMTFAEEGRTDGATHSMYLMPRSLCVLSGESRWRWAHGIPARVSDCIWDVEGVLCKRQRGPRLSVTVRWYKLDNDDEGASAHHSNEDEDNSVDSRLAVSQQR